MSSTPEQPQTPEPEPAATPAATPARAEKTKTPAKQVHEVRFTAYPKLLFVWPVILAGLVLWPFGAPAQRPAGTADAEATTPPAAVETTAGVDQPTEAPAADEAELADTDTEADTDTSDQAEPARPYSARLETLAWIYIWVMVIVLLTLGVDIDRNHMAFWVVAVVAVWMLGLWLQDTKGFTFFGDIYNWFAGLQAQYDRSLALAVSVVLLVPYVLMLIWARINDRWRITHNEFEHYSFGKTDDSLGRGAKTIRSSYPDLLELLLGLAGTLIVYNATGARELRRIPHVMFLPFVRVRLNTILERTAITAAQMEDEEEEDEDM